MRINLIIEKIEGIIRIKKFMNNLNEGPSVLSECFLIKDINLYETIILSDNIKRTSENN